MTLYDIGKRDILLFVDLFHRLDARREKWLHRLLNDYRPIIDEFTRAASSNGVNSSYVGGTICSRVTENFSPGTYCDPYRFTLGEFHLETSCFFLPCAMICWLYELADQNSCIQRSVLISLSVISCFLSVQLLPFAEKNKGIRFFYYVIAKLIVAILRYKKHVAFLTTYSNKLKMLSEN